TTSRRSRWGLFDEGRFAAIHGEFLRGFDKLEVMAMDYETIAERLLSEGVVGSTQAANATANIAMKWMQEVELARACG
ncbi:hypothetical protein AAIH11_36990, partial [Pseudomonas aeruginosa]